MSGRIWAGAGADGKTDSEAAARRRKMTIQLREARRSLSEPDAIPSHSSAMVRLFAEINRSATPMLGIIALGVCATALAWIDAGPLVTWITFIACAIATGYSLPIAFLDSSDKEKTAGVWRRKFVFSTALSGSAWAYLIVIAAPIERPERAGFRHRRDAACLDRDVASGGGHPRRVRRRHAAHDRRRDASLRPPSARGGVAGGGACRSASSAISWSSRGACTPRPSNNMSFQAEKDSLIAELEQAKLNSDEARRRAESANLAKSRFLATMSHELRTPLNAVLGFSEVMKGELFGPHAVPAYKEYSSDIHASGQHLLMLINEILDLSRVEAGRYELKEEPVSLTGVVEECLRLLWLRIERRHLVIAEAMEDGLPRIWADERAVRQVTLNLLTNAIKFTPQGGSITIKVGWTRRGGQYLSIRDTGPGIPPEEIPSCCRRSAAARSRRRMRRKGRASGCRSSRDWSSCTAGSSVSTPLCASERK